MRNDRDTTVTVLDWLLELIERRSLSREQRAILSLVINEGKGQVDRHPHGLPAAEVPLAVYAAAGGTASALPAAAACLCVYLGADVLDNVIDRELSSRWDTIGGSQAILAGVTMGACFSTMCLDELDIPVERLLAARGLVSNAIFEMLAGEMSDVAFEGADDVSLEACEAMVVAKSGAEGALFARLGALTAGASPHLCEEYATFGRELGTTIQITSDCADLVEGGEERDLASGKRTLPIVYALSVLSETGRSDLLGHLAASEHDAARRPAVRRMLLDAGSLQYSALVAEVHRQRAISALRRAHPAEPHASRLYDMVGNMAIGTPHMADAGTGVSTG